MTTTTTQTQTQRDPSDHDDVAGPLDMSASLVALRERAAARLADAAPARPAILDARIAFTFAGQGAPYVDEVRELLATRGAARDLVLACVDAIVDESKSLSPIERARIPLSLDPSTWPATLDDVVMARAPLSAPFAVIVQLARAEQLRERGLAPIASHTMLAGHSQGALGALALASMLGAPERRVAVAQTFARVALRLGVAMEQHDAPAAPPSIATKCVEDTGRAPGFMAGLKGFFVEELRALVEASGATVTIAVENAPHHQTLAGAPAELERLRRVVVAQAKERVEQKKKGKAAGRVVDPKWTWLDVSGPFHTPFMTEAATSLKRALRERGLVLAPRALACPVINAATGLPFADDGSALDDAIDAILVQPGSWRRAMNTLVSHGVQHVIDVGPGVDVAHLAGSAIRGRGVAVHAALEAQQAIVDAREAPARPRAFRDFAPRAVVLPSGERRIENKFTQVTGRPPVFVPGMTPTTVESPIVVAAANAGYVAELAGGGQVTEKIMRARFDEIVATLAPGQGVVFNALYLDPYLWGLHFAKDRLVLKLRDEGYPIVGVTVSAGIPPVEDAVALLDELVARGITWNAFKPGNDRQLDEVIAIAKQRPSTSILVHIEGGKAGGHHSWEDLDDLLVRHYARLREHDNLVICVGGGIGTEDQAASYIDGRWSERYGLVAMPVDAVFLGTRLMATKEARTSDAVKRALVEANGDEQRWPLDGKAVGGVTSGRSSLDAPIYYLDNAAAQCGRLLDEVAGDGQKVAARRDDIISLLAKTSKPFFGDVETMSPEAVLRRIVALMHTERDGWTDDTWRSRFVEMVARFEARFGSVDDASFATAAAAGEPDALIAALVERCAALRASAMHPEDVRFFLEVCKRPGKPVPFVPVIDADVRRWFKSDALWQSHDERYGADAVLAIPGPAAVRAIRVVDEPVADVLAQFHARMIERTTAEREPVAAAPIDVVARMRAIAEVRDLANRAYKNPLADLFGDNDSVRLDAQGRVIARLTASGAKLIAEHGELDLCISFVDDGCGGWLRWDRERFLDEQHVFMSRALFGDVVTAVPLFADAVEPVVLTAARARDFRFATSDDTAHDGTAPITMAFPLAWRAIFRALAGARPDVLRLVHEGDVVEGGPLRVGDELTATARVVRVETLPGGRRVSTTATLSRPDGARVATVESRFFIRESVKAAPSVVEHRRVEAVLPVNDEGTLDFLRALEDTTLAADVVAPVVITLTGHVTTEGNEGTFAIDGKVVGHTRASLDRLVEILGERTQMSPVDGDGALGTKRTTAPAEMDAYAHASGDHNPLHVHDGAAALAGFDAPIVHGMWTASWTQHRVARLAADGDASRIERFDATFLAPVARGAQLAAHVKVIGRERGALIVQADVEDTTTNVIVAQAKARVRPPSTAYVFCGQGVQHAGMGMDTYERSPAARAIWDEADAVCRTQHGFSLLDVVKQNPRELWVRGTRLVHPEGVLHLTQLTQVALAVMAVAEIEHLKERGALVDGARFAGHSLGEYSALAAVPRVLPLAAVVNVVYQRGLTMDRLVQRDADGRSPYAMGALRPNLAGMSEAEALELVEKIAAETGLPVFVVNHNVRGRQYAVTGDRRALATLRDTVNRRSGAARPAWVDVPGIDVPFHSPLLRAGVDAFREKLEDTLPARVDADALHNRYVPNLTGTVFRLEPAFLKEMIAASGSSRVAALLDRFDDAMRDRGAFARALLIEALAYQFASPVRWIQAQDVLFSGADAVDDVVEIGPAKSPVLVGMAKAMLENQRRAVRVRHAGVDRVSLFGVLPVETDAAPVKQADVVVDAKPITAAAVVEAPKAAAAPTTRALAEPASLADDALVTLLCVVAKKERHEIDLSRSLDHLLGGNSARRNQVLAELAAELGGRAVDNAHEIPLKQLASMLPVATKGEPGPVLKGARDQATHKLLGAGGIDVAKADAHWADAWGLSPAHREMLKNRVTTRARSGAAATDRASAIALLDDVVKAYGAEIGVAIEKPSAQSASVAVDAGALTALEDRLFGVDGVLTRAAHVLKGGAAVVEHKPAVVVREDVEHDAAYMAAVQGVFDEKRHVAFTSSWAWARRDLIDPTVPVSSVARRLDDAARVLASRMATDARESGDVARAERIEAILSLPRADRAFAKRTALVTGAGDGSIARSVVEKLLADGARVIVTTSRTTPDAIKSFKRVYQEHASLGAELHVVPANQGSFADVDALCAWLASSKKERVGSSERVLKEPWLPDLLVPFGAISETADTTSMGPRSLAMFRVLVLGVERLAARIATQHGQRGDVGSRVHVVLPLSPNHGTFGGDGAYGECKLALEALLEKQRSESRGWGKHASIVGARIGWVRGTGLMHQNDDVAPVLEQRGLKTFSTHEMASLLIELMHEGVRERAARAPFIADLTGGLGDVGASLSTWLMEAKVANDRKARREKRKQELLKLWRPEAKPAARRTKLARPMLDVATPTDDDLARLPQLDHLDLDELVVIVGTGEVGPYGSARTRWAIERGSDLSIEAVLELAWIMGLVKPNEKTSGFVDSKTNEVIRDDDVIARYLDAIRAHTGVRIIEPGVTGFDPRKLSRLVDVRLEQDFKFPVPSKQIADALVAEDPEHTTVVDGGAAVLRKRGSIVRVPAALAVHRHVAGQIPTGWDATRYGVPKELVDQVDPVTLYCLVSTAEAFLAAGLSPEELYAHLHPGRVGITIGTGIGGMTKLKKLHRDFFEGNERQNDTLQETLINVIGGYVVQTFLGSYGPMSFPVGACATAGLSLAEAVDKIRTGQADLVVAGGADDLSEAGNIGFGDMGATADTDELASRGVEPKHMSRPSDARRRGFVEAQGAGVSVVCRASLAVKLGLPVYGVVAFAGTTGDGLQKSVPAPGQGALVLAAERRHGSDAHDSTACDLDLRRRAIRELDARRADLVAMFGAERADAMIRDERRRLGHTFFVGREDVSPLRGALAVLGLTADDVGVVSKHDSSTQANDLNEARLHETMMTSLGRSEDKPLFVISQKALTGHPKGAAAAWQLNGVLQAMSEGVIPGNASLDDVDVDMRAFSRLVWSDRALRVDRLALKAGVVTTLGFGHVSALVCLAHPFLFWRALDASTRAAYAERLAARKRTADARLQAVLSGRAPMFTVREPKHEDASTEARRLLDAGWRA